MKQSFEAALEASRILSIRAPGNKNAMFASILCIGLHSDYLALIEERYVASFGEMKAGRALAGKLLAADPQFYDAWLAVGVENYMLSIRTAPVRSESRRLGNRTAQTSPG